MNKDMLSFIETFRLKDFTIYESKHWIWSMRWGQPTLGCGVLSLKRHAYELNELLPEESEDMAHIVKVIEQTSKDTFGYEIMNYLMLMMFDKHVHYHVIPRYSKEKEFEGKKYLDKGWPYIPNLVTEREEAQTLLKIKEAFQKNILL